MEGKEQNLISIIIIAVFLLAPMIMKLLGKKFVVKQPHAEEEEPDDSMHHPHSPEIPKPPRLTPEPGDHMPPPVHQTFSDKPIKPKWF
ncbi:MAG TPA: hypothetical protein VIS94_08590 [Desulfomonilia bacterium]|jgi:hypothetical protein